MIVINTSKKRGLAYKGGLLMIFVLGLSSVFSPIRAVSFFNLIWAVCIVGWVFFTFLEKPFYFIMPTKFRFLVYLYLIYTIFIAYMSGNGNIGNRYFELSQLPLFYLAYEKNKLQGRNCDNILLLKLIAPFILITSFITLNAYRINPNISRSLKVSQGIGIQYLKRGVGGYEYIYFLVILVPVLVFVITNKEIKVKKSQKIIGVFTIFVFSINIILSNYSTAMLLLILGFVFKIFLSKIKKTRILFYSFAFVIMYLLYKPILLFLLDILFDNLNGGTRNAARILEIKNFILGGNGGVSLDARNDAFRESINVFFENPILGMVIEPLEVNIYGQIVGFGQHSQILDTFALFGMFIGVLQLYIYSHPIYMRINDDNGYLNGFPLSILFIFLVLVTVNVATPSIGFAVFFIFPTIYQKYLDHKYGQ